MTVHATAELLSSYLDAELDPARAEALENHLSHCAHCRSRLSSLSGVVGELRRLDRVGPPPILGRELLRRVALERPPRSWLDRLETKLAGLRYESPILLVFALVFALASILYLFAHGVERYQRRSIPVVVAPAAGTTAEPEELHAAPHWAAGKVFDLEGDTWRERGTGALPPSVRLAAAEPEGRAVLARHPGVADLLADGERVILRDGDHLVEIRASP